MKTQKLKKRKIASKFDRLFHLLELVKGPFASTSFLRSLHHLRTGYAGASAGFAGMNFSNLRACQGVQNIFLRSLEGVLKKLIFFSKIWKRLGLWHILWKSIFFSSESSKKVTHTKKTAKKRKNRQKIWGLPPLEVCCGRRETTPLSSRDAN